MPTTYRIDSFTLTEVIVTMVVSSLVVLLAYMALQMLNNYFVRTNYESALYSERLSMRTVLTKDLDQADSVKWEDPELHIYSPNTLVSWQADSTLLLRKRGDEIKSFRVGRSEVSPEYFALTGLVGQIDIGWLVGTNDSVVFTFHKPYTLATRMNR